MYPLAIYISIILLILLISFQITTQRSSQKRIRTSLSICLLISTLISFTPKYSLEGAPFHKYGQEKIAFLACNYQISLTTRFCEDTNELCFCNNPNAFATIAHCYSYGHPDQIPSFLNMCKRECNKTITMDQFVQAHEYYLENSKSIDGVPNYPPEKVVDFPVKLDNSRILLFKGSYDHFLGNYDRSVDYGSYVVLYWVGVFALVAIGNWSKFLFPQFYKKHLTGRLTNWFRKTISLPSTWGKYKTEEMKLGKIFDLIVPTRVETIILITLSVLCVYLTTTNMTYLEGDPLFPTKYEAVLRYHAVRLSFLGSSLMPLLILFGGRNNFLQWITKWEYSTFITLHRWISRITIILILFHSIFYSLYIGLKNKNKAKEPFILWGGVGTLSGIIIIIQGLLVLRRKWYEVFLLLHIFLAVIFLVASWFHVRDLYCTWFYFISTMIWVFDRIIRIGRLWEFGFPQAKLFIAGRDTLKVVVPKPENWEAIPGGHAFIHFLVPSSFWQSHPFTYTATLDEIVLYIKVKKGITLSLYQQLLRRGGYTRIRVAIEGSYGEKAPASTYDNAVFIAGGSGIPGIFAEAFDLVKNRNPKKLVKLIWVVRDYESAMWFSNELQSLKETNIETIVYVTRTNTVLRNTPRMWNSETRLQPHEEIDMLQPLIAKSNSYDSTVAEQQSPGISVYTNSRNEIVRDLSHITFKTGKPDIDELVRANVQESLGSTCFVACGHPRMVDDIRASVIGNMDKTEGKRIDFYEKLQVWA